ncbi:MAG: 1-deoxy-D-xylulose-5-phosphate synthase [Legionellales bacterium]|nr:1-deoxy-D-xylulose-5-phosphate synthase [Legionellales bacterium]
MDPKQFKLLHTINTPADLRTLSRADLPALCAEIREWIYTSLNQCGGHFAASLGVVELTVALHTVFNTPVDQLIWDVGHQAYVHKILTGRKELLSTIRQTHGLAPFPKREESQFDAFGVGHSSTSISAALGMAIAAKLDKSERHSIAVIGDGAMTAGMAFEALNHAGHTDANLIVILNDNDMSISNNVGALSQHFTKMLSGSTYAKLREHGKKILNLMPSPMRDLVKHTESQVKELMTEGVGNLFEALGFDYSGPIDGHDVDLLLTVLSSLKHKKGPRLLHVITQKGKGYYPAECDPIEYHAVKPGFYQREKKSSKPSAPTYSNIFGQWLCDIAALDERIVGITPAMREGSDLIQFSQEYPERYMDVAIAEQHSVTLAAGLACQGKKPIVAIYSTFLQRAYDQLIHDVALQNLPVVFALDRAGIVGGDGSTHNGAFDLAFLRCIPNIMIMAPADENEMRQMLYTAYKQSSPVCVRYPRGTGPGIAIEKNMRELPIGKAEIKRQGKKIALLAFGSMVYPLIPIAEELNATLINMRFVKPLDQLLIIHLAKTHDLIVTIEENSVMGGAGSGVNEVLAKTKCLVPVLNIGLTDEFIEHGDPHELLAENGLHPETIKQKILQFSQRQIAQHIEAV